jgi:ketosteroid isomerase-like protein
MSRIAVISRGVVLKNAVAILILITAAMNASTIAQTTQAVTEPDPLKAIGVLRETLVDAFNKGDINRLLSQLDPDAVVTWQNGEVCRGPAAVRAYYDKMMASPDHIVTKLSIAPVVDDRHVYGDWAVSWGNLHDEYILKDGTTFRFDSRFTATIAKRGDAWKITSFHASVNAFDNPILGMAAKRTAAWVGAIAGVIGLVIGSLAILVLKRKKPSAAS